MKKIIVMVVVASAALVMAGEKTKKAGAIFVPAADAKWAPVPEHPEVQMAVLDGDPTKGASHFLMKFPAGFAAPLHHHTADHYVGVVSGTMVLTSDGKEQKLTAGSFFSFTGKTVHGTSCAAGADCVIMVDSRGKWDLVMEQKAAPKS